MSPLCYSAFGLRIVSDLEIPEFMVCHWAPNVQPNLQIRYGSVPLSLDHPKVKGVLFQAKPGYFLLSLDGIARYLVCDGKSIIIERARNSREDQLRLFLLGSPLAALLHQQGILVLHGSAINTEKGAILFLGSSSVGKSALALTFWKRGYSIITDEICALKSDNSGNLRILPGNPQIKVWVDVIKTLNVSFNLFYKLRQRINKYTLSIQPEVDEASIPLHKVFVLGVHNLPSFSFEELRGHLKFTNLLRHTYQPMLVKGFEFENYHFTQLGRAANQIKLYKLMRPSKPFLLEEEADLILENMI